MSVGGVNVGGARASQSQVAKAFGLLRPGMWVRYSGKIGILNAFKVDEKTSGVFAEVHIVNPSNGETEKVVSADLGALSQASLADIPESRRPDEALATRLGYA